MTRLAEVVRFEVAYQSRRIWPWVTAAALLGVAFLLTRDGSLAEALYEDFFLNSPFAIAKTTVVGGLVWLLIGAAVAGEAAARDVATGMHPLAWTTSVRESEYLAGRFLAALTINAAVLMAVPAGVLVAVYAPGVDAAIVGPFRPEAYLTAFVFLALPNAFAATAVQFWLAARSGRPMAAYLGSLLLFLTSYVVATVFFVQGRQGVANTLDVLGVHFILSELSQSWTSYEKSHRLLTLEGTVLANRLLWIGVGTAALAATWTGFRFEARGERRRWVARLRPTPAASPEPHAAPLASAEGARPSFGALAEVRRTLAIGGASARAVVLSWAGAAFLVALPLLTVLLVVDEMAPGGVRQIPRTALVLRELTGALASETSPWVIVPLVIVYFAGELVWRERDAGVAEMADAMPGSAWGPLLGKLLGLAIVVAAFVGLQGAAGIAAQSLLGYDEHQVGLYATVLFGLQLPEYLLFAALALTVHAMVDQKYVAHLVAVLLWVALALSSLVGVEHPMLRYGAGPAWSYSDLRGFGDSLGPWAWFKAYWAAWAVVLMVAARLFWPRGNVAGFTARLARARRRLVGRTARVAAGGVVLVTGLGVFVLHNTNVRNGYRGSEARAAAAAEYERRYARFADAPHPTLRSVSLRVEIAPERGEVDVRGTYDLVNAAGRPVDSVHVATAPEVETGAIAFDRPATLVVADDDLGHRVYALEAPLLPGDSLGMTFAVRRERRGFTVDGVDGAVTTEAASFTNAWFPAVGYQPARELVQPADRRRYGLEARPVIASLEDADVDRDPARGVRFEAVVGTSADQMTVASGDLRRSWTEGDRRWDHWVADAPIGGEWAFLSADYAVRERRWRDVRIRLFHHPDHTGMVDRFLESLVASLDNYTERFGPYPFGHLTLAERPGTGAGMHADPGLITFSEGAALWDPAPRPGAVDLPFAVVAHEVAHQWTVPYAVVEGAPVMSEGLAWYYAMDVVEEARGAEGLHRLLRFMRGPYPYRPIRRGEPLLRGLDPYQAYRRGPFALHALSRYLGAPRVDGALRRLLETHRAPGAPPATTLDLYRTLHAAAPDSMHALLHDLFEVNTYWDLATDRVTAREVERGRWEVTMDVRARKVVWDAQGVDREVPMDEWIEVGAFARPQEGSDELARPVYLRRHRLRSGTQRLTFVLASAEPPWLAGVDPHHVLDWAEDGDDDNVEAVVVRE